MVRACSGGLCGGLIGRVDAMEGSRKNGCG